MGARYRWAILAVGVVAQASFSAVFFGIPVLAPALRAEYALTLGELGVVLASVNVGMLLTVLPWGVLADRIGERVVMAVGLTVGAASLAGAALTEHFATLVVALTAAGAFGACVQAASGRAVMGWFGVRERGFALGIRQTAVVVGGAFAALVLPVTTGAGGVRAGLLVLALATLTAALASAAALRNPARSPAVPAPLAEALRDRRLWRLCFGSALLVVAQVAVLGFTVLFLHDERGFSTGEAAAVLAIMQVLGGIFRIGSGRWSDRVGTRIAPLLRLGFALAVALAVAAALVDAPSLVLVPALVAAGSLSASWNALSFTAAAELAGEARAGAALGLQQASLALGAAVTPIAFAALVDGTSWAIAFALAGVSALAGTASLVGLAAREAEIA